MLPTQNVNNPLNCKLFLQLFSGVENWFALFSTSGQADIKSLLCCPLVTPDFDDHETASVSLPASEDLWRESPSVPLQHWGDLSREDLSREDLLKEDLPTEDFFRESVSLPLQLWEAWHWKQV